MPTSSVNQFLKMTLCCGAKLFVSRHVWDRVSLLHLPVCYLSLINYHTLLRARSLSTHQEWNDT